MMAITAAEVNKLRKMTGAGMMDCKKALTEVNGEFEKAIELLRKKGQKVSDSRADRETSEGVVFAKTNADATEGVLLAFSCETDFVAKNKEFVELGHRITELVFHHKPINVEEILSLPLDELTVKEKIMELTGKIGEKIEVKTFETLYGEAVVTYIHSNAKLGVLVILNNINGVDINDAGKDIAMQIAAMNPVAVNKEGIDASIVNKEIEISKERARQEGKPEKIIEKIVMGRLNKFFKENTLLNQDFVKDSSLTVLQYLDSVSKGMTVKEFKRVEIG